MTGCIPNGLQDVSKNDFPFLDLRLVRRNRPGTANRRLRFGEYGDHRFGTLVDRYDDDDSGTIEKSEVIQAINDYLFGGGDEAISKAEVIELINLYLFG